MADDVKTIMRYRVEANAPLQYQKPILLMQGDKRANVLEVSLFDGEKAVDLSGLSVGGSVTRADGAEVDIDGTIAGNVITCVLNGYAYAVAGPFKAAVKLLDALGDVKRTVLLLAGTVEESGSGPQIDTGKEMPSLEDVLAQLETMKSATRDANAAAKNALAAAEAAGGAQQEAVNAATAAGNAAATAAVAAGNANTAADRANQAVEEVENGTAPNTEKLGGKEPEYYLQPRNLLINSNFEKAVNQRGKESYTGTGYTIDKWKTNFSGDTVSVTQKGVRNTNQSTGTGWHLHQIVEECEWMAGKTFTAAFSIADYSGARLNVIVSFRDSSDSEIKSASATVNVGIVTVKETAPQGTKNVRVGLYAFSGITAGEYVEMQWVAMYEGDFTADKLPPYVSNEYETELAMCRRYYREFNCNNSFDIVFPGYITTDGTTIVADVPVDMQGTKTPEILFEGSLTFRGVGGYLQNSASGYAEVSMSVYRAPENGRLCIAIQKTDGTMYEGATNNTPVMVNMRPGSKLAFSVEP